MASSSRAATSGTTRKLAWLAAAVVLTVALYSGGWFYAAGWLRDRLAGRLDASREQMVSLSCGDLSVRGFPFRIGVFCDTVGVDDRPSGLSATFGALRSAAQVYRPGHAVLELDGPAQVRVTPDRVFVADWSLMRASAVAWTDGLDRGSLAYDGLKGRLNAPSAGLSLGVSAAHGEAHLRRSGEALDAAGSAEGLALDVGGRVLPPLDAAVDMTIADAARWISADGPPEDAPYGAKLELRRLSLDLGDGRRAALSGPLTIGEDGFLSGTLDLDIEGVSAWRDRVVEAFPEVEETARRIAQAILGLSGGRERAVVKLNLRDGTVYLGPFPIAFVPPI